MKFAFIRRFFGLVILILLASAGMLYWFDYLGLYPFKARFIKEAEKIAFVRDHVLGRPSSPSFLEFEDRAKERELMDEKALFLLNRAAVLSNWEATLKEKEDSLIALEKTLRGRESSYKDSKERELSYQKELGRQAVYYESMLPDQAVERLLLLDDTDIIDILLTMDEKATRVGRRSLVPVYLALFPAERASDIQRKMLEKSRGFEHGS